MKRAILFFVLFSSLLLVLCGMAYADDKIGYDDNGDEYIITDDPEVFPATKSGRAYQSEEIEVYIFTPNSSMSGDYESNVLGGTVSLGNEQTNKFTVYLANNVVREYEGSCTLQLRMKLVNSYYKYELGVVRAGQLRAEWSLSEIIRIESRIDMTSYSNYNNFTSTEAVNVQIVNGSIYYQIGVFFTAAIGWFGSLAEAIASTPILFIFLLGVPVVLFVVSLVLRLVRSRARRR